jgi:hypothetical protein
MRIRHASSGAGKSASFAGGSTEGGQSVSAHDYRRRCNYRYAGREWSYDELRNEVETEAAGLPPEQWFDGEFVFNAWLSDSVVTGHVEKVGDEDGD